MANLNPLENPYQVHFIGKGRESNGQWYKSKTISSTNNSTNPLKLNWTSITTSGDGKIVMACINNGQVYLSSQYGYNLVAVTALPTAAWSCIRVSTDGTLAVASIMGGGIFVGNFDGSIWNWIDSGAITAQWSSVAISNNKLSIIACIYHKDSYPYGAFLATYSANWTWTQPNGWDKNAYWTSITFSGDNLTIATCQQSFSNNGPNISIFNTSTNEWGPLNVSATFPNNYYWTSITKFGSSKNFVACVNGIGIFTAIYNENPITPVWGWTQTSAPTAAWSSIASDSTGQYVMACVNGGGIYSSWDYGSSWQLQDNNGLPATASWSAVAYGNTCSNVVACATNDYIYVSPSFQGYVWNSSYGLNLVWKTIASDSSGQNIIAGPYGNVPAFTSNGYIYISNDYGISWSSNLSILGSNNWNSVATNYDGSIYGAVIYFSSAYIYSNNGSTWYTPNLGGSVTFNGNQITFDMAGNNCAICSYTTNYSGTVTENGRIYLCNNPNEATSTWVETIPDTLLPTLIYQWFAIKFSGNGIYIYACFWTDNNASSYTSGIYKGTYSSSGPSCTWEQVYTPTNPLYFQNISCSYTGQYIAASIVAYLSGSAQIIISNDYGLTWNIANGLPSTTSSGYGFFGITMSKNGKNIATTFYNDSSSSGVIFISTDYGITWTSQINGLPTSQNAWSPIACNESMTKLITGANAQAWNNSGSSGIFTGYISTTSWTSQQNGLPTLCAFTKLSMSNNGKYIAVAAYSNSIIINSLGGIWISLDYGQTWLQSDAGNLSWNAIGCDNTGQYLVAAVNGGSIYTSSNYGLNWTIQSASSGLPTTANWDSISFSSNSDPNSTSQFVYASIYDGYIYFSEDRGLTWTQINLNSYWSNGITSSGDGNIGYYGINWPVGGIYKTIQTNPITISQINGTGGYWNYLSCDSTGQYIAAVFTDISGDYLNTSYGIYLNSNYGDSNYWVQLASKALYWNSVSLINMGNYLLITAICTNGLIYTCTYNIPSTPPNPLYVITGGSWVENKVGDNYTLTCTQGDSNTNIVFNDSILINVTVVGGGGGGAAVAAIAVVAPLGGGGGGGGIAIKSFNTVTYQSYTTIVGSGGQVNSHNNGSPGTSSSFSDGNTINIVGSGGGGGSVNSSGGVGGSGTGGSNNYLGGKGGSGNTIIESQFIAGTNGENSSLTPYSGGGGGANYVIVSDTQGYLYGGYAGSAGIGGSINYPLANGQAATTYGSGGGGSATYASSAGNGYKGVIVITFTYPPPLYTWTLQGNIPASICNDIKSTILPSGEAQLVMCSLNGGIWLSSDSGATWSQSTLPYNYQNMPAITSSSIGQNQVAIINNTPPYISTNYGLNWNQLINTGLPSTEGWYSIASSLTCQYIVLSTVIGAIYVSFNYGQSWALTSNIQAYPLLSMSSSGKIIAAASVNGTIYKSTDYGFSWVQLSILNGLPSASEAWSSIALSNNGQFMIASINGGKIYKSADYGQSWTLINSPLATWSSVAISSTGQCMVACINGGKIYGSTDFGETLNIINNTNGNWSSLAISGSGQNIVATINGGLIYGSSDFGSTWSQINSTTVANWKSITSSISGQYLAAINSNSTETNIYINSNFMDIGNVLSSLITQLQIEIQCNSEQAPTGSSVYYLGTTDPNGWVIMDGQPRQNNGEYNNLITLGIGTTSNNNTIYTPPNTGVNWILKL
jgi:hypothetical protein